MAKCLRALPVSKAVALSPPPRTETIINGQKAMPPLGQFFNDRQIAEIVNYIRTNFGNRYTDKVTAAEVKTMR